MFLLVGVQYGDRVTERGGRPKVQIVIGVKVLIQAGQIGAYESISEDVANCGQNGGFGRALRLTGERNQCSELIARLIFKNSCRCADQGLPEEFEDVVLFDITRQAEDS